MKKMEPICIDSDDDSPPKVSKYITANPQPSDDEFFQSQPQIKDVIMPIEIISPNSQKSLVEKFNKTKLKAIKINYKTVEKKYPRNVYVGTSRLKANKQMEVICLDSSDEEVTTVKLPLDLSKIQSRPAKKTVDNAITLDSSDGDVPYHSIQHSESYRKANMDIDLSSDGEFRSKRPKRESTSNIKSSSNRHSENNRKANMDIDLDGFQKIHPKTIPSISDKVYMAQSNLDLTSDEEVVPLKIKYSLFDKEPIKAVKKLYSNGIISDAIGVDGKSYGGIEASDDKVNRGVEAKRIMLELELSSDVEIAFGIGGRKPISKVSGSGRSSEFDKEPREVKKLYSSGIISDATGVDGKSYGGVDAKKFRLELSSDVEIASGIGGRKPISKVSGSGSSSEFDKEPREVKKLYSSGIVSDATGVYGKIYGGVDAKKFMLELSSDVEIASGVGGRKPISKVSGSGGSSKFDKEPREVEKLYSSGIISDATGVDGESDGGIEASDDKDNRGVEEKRVMLELELSSDVEIASGIGGRNLISRPIDDLFNMSAYSEGKREKLISKVYGRGKSTDISLVLSSDEDLAPKPNKGNARRSLYSSNDDKPSNKISSDEDSEPNVISIPNTKKSDYSILSSDDEPRKPRKDPKLLRKPKAKKNYSKFSSDDSDLPTMLAEPKKKRKKIKTALTSDVHSEDKKSNFKLSRELKKREKDLEKEQKRREKELLKEQKEVEKQEKDKENSLKTANKRNQLTKSTQEIIVQICKKWKASGETDVFIELLEGLGSKFLPIDMPFTNSLTFIRKVESIYNFTENIWIPCELSHETEHYLLLLLTGQELAQMIINTSVDSFIKKCNDKYPGYCIIILLEDLDQYFKRKYSVTKRVENQKIRNLVEKPTKINTTAKDLELINGPDEKQISETMLYMQLYEKWKCKIHTCIKQETSTWIVSFTQQIANAPRMYSQSAEGVGLRFGDTVKSGKDNGDTWRRMLRQIPGVSEKHSEAIVQVYPTIGAFFKKFLKEKGEGKSYFEGIVVEGNGNRSQVGKTVAARIADVLLSKDPGKKI